MKNPTRWTKLWWAITLWWKNEPPLNFPPPPEEVLCTARGFLREYDDLYGQRTQINIPHFRSQAAEAVLREGHKRAPGLESEVRVISLVAERILFHLDLESERQRNLQ